MQRRSRLGVWPFVIRRRMKPRIIVVARGNIGRFDPRANEGRGALYVASRSNSRSLFNVTPPVGSSHRDKSKTVSPHNPGRPRYHFLGFQRLVGGVIGITA